LVHLLAAVVAASALAVSAKAKPSMRAAVVVLVVAATAALVHQGVHGNLSDSFCINIGLIILCLFIKSALL